MRRSALVLVLVLGASFPLWLGAPPASGATAPPATPPPSTADGDQPGESLELGLADVVLLGPATTGAGDRPEFSWEAVAGAASYSLAVLSADDVPNWSWLGAETAVILGGWPQQPVPVAPGPLILVPSKWFVVAYDAAGAPIANSVIRPVAP